MVLALCTWIGCPTSCAQNPPTPIHLCPRPPHSWVWFSSGWVCTTHPHPVPGLRTECRPSPSPIRHSWAARLTPFPTHNPRPPTHTDATPPSDQGPSHLHPHPAYPHNNHNNSHSTLPPPYPTPSSDPHQHATNAAALASSAGAGGVGPPIQRSDRDAGGGKPRAAGGGAAAVRAAAAAATTTTHSAADVALAQSLFLGEAIQIKCIQKGGAAPGLEPGSPAGSGQWGAAGVPGRRGRRLPANPSTTAAHAAATAAYFAGA